MIAELGLFLLTLALGLALVQTLFPVVGLARGQDIWLAYVGPAARAQFGCLLAAFAALIHAFLTNDFTLAYVAHNSNSALPWLYRISAVWGAHEGSLLLWALILAGWTWAVSLRTERLPADIGAVVIGVMGAVSVAFLLFMLFTSNPFLRGLPAPADGADLNPLLQDPGLIIHPPILYMGYVGFAVPFAFAIAALVRGRLTPGWARWVRPWALAAWAFLTVGIALGSWWAYYELGWGGWWFWDPVENASFMPWLLGTALVHSLAVTDKRGSFKSWTVLLAIGAFSLSLLGTFLVRSGVLTSVHAFATDPERGIFVLLILGVTVGGSLALYAWRGPSMLAGGRYSPVSRETFLLANSLLLAVTTATIALGTLYPLVLDTLNLGKISVGPPYFNLVFGLMMAPLAVALGLGQFAHWREDNLARLWQRTRLVAGAALVLGLVTAGVIDGPQRVSAGVGLALAGWIIATSLRGLWARLAGRASWWGAVAALPASAYGQSLAHSGFAVAIAGVCLTTALSVDRHARMAPGDRLALAAYEFRFEALRDIIGPNYKASEARFTVWRAGQQVAELYPQKRLYNVRAMPLTEAGILPRLAGDLYISLGEPLEGQAWSVRISYKAYVRWVWLGALMMAGGGVLALRDRRYRQTVALPAQPRAASGA
ncbi:MAG: heme lyase CcmF/NrfE family subunit [Gammaproteobacteria bacterium]|nr:heme lyase CcmF/NrfE family subunit [Gammaproteobacteria bacterium]